MLFKRSASSFQVGRGMSLSEFVVFLDSLQSLQSMPTDKNAELRQQLIGAFNQISSSQSAADHNSSLIQATIALFSHVRNQDWATTTRFYTQNYHKRFDLDDNLCPVPSDASFAHVSPHIYVGSFEVSASSQGHITYGNGFLLTPPTVVDGVTFDETDLKLIISQMIDKSYNMTTEQFLQVMGEAKFKLSAETHSDLLSKFHNRPLYDD